LFAVSLLAFVLSFLIKQNDLNKEMDTQHALVENKFTKLVEGRFSGIITSREASDVSDNEGGKLPGKPKPTYGNDMEDTLGHKRMGSEEYSYTYGDNQTQPSKGGYSHVGAVEQVQHGGPQDDEDDYGDLGNRASNATTVIGQTLFGGYTSVDQQHSIPAMAQPQLAGYDQYTGYAGYAGSHSRQASNTSDVQTFSGDHTRNRSLSPSGVPLAYNGYMGGDQSVPLMPAGYFMPGSDGMQNTMPVVPVGYMYVDGEGQTQAMQMPTMQMPAGYFYMGGGEQLDAQGMQMQMQMQMPMPMPMQLPTAGYAYPAQQEQGVQEHSGQGPTDGSGLMHSEATSDGAHR
jgi:hypothetical protein